MRMSDSGRVTHIPQRVWGRGVAVCTAEASQDNCSRDGQRGGNAVPGAGVGEGGVGAGGS